MASVDYFECEDCGFKWKDQGPLFFFYNEEETEIVEYIFIKSTWGIDDGTLISGDVVETYCTNCNKKIKLYVISMIKKPYDEESAIKTIYEAIENNKINKKHYEFVIRDTDLKDDFFIVDLSKNFYSSKEYTCPNCESEILRHLLAKNKCPKCEGDIKSVDGMCLD